MKIKSLAVIVTTDENKAYQVALTNDKIDALISDLRNLYFSDGVIKILDNELSGLEIVTRKELNKEEEQKSDSIMSDIISESDKQIILQSDRQVNDLRASINHPKTKRTASCNHTWMPYLINEHWDYMCSKCGNLSNNIAG